jgi:hypothetical protein
VPHLNLSKIEHKNCKQQDSHFNSTQSNFETQLFHVKGGRGYMPIPMTASNKLAIIAGMTHKTLSPQNRLDKIPNYMKPLMPDRL